MQGRKGEEKKSRITTRNRENKVNIWRTNPTYQRIAKESFIMPLLSRPSYAPSSLLPTLTPSLPPSHVHGMIDTIHTSTDGLGEEVVTVELLFGTILVESLGRKHVTSGFNHIVIY